MRALFCKSGASRESPDLEKEQKSMEAGLWTKSWVMHCILMFSRVLYPFLGRGNFQKGYEDINAKVNIEFAERLRLPVTIISISLVVVGVLLAIATWRKRSLARLLIYYELLNLIV